MSDKEYLIKGEMYQYNLGWLIKELMSFKQDLATAIDLKTIKYADPIQWDITTQYPANTVVVDPKSGTAYMSKVPVPAGVELKNANYWVVVFNYQDIYNKIMDGVAFNDRNQDYATKDLLVNDLVWYAGELYRVTRAIPIGSKYIPGTNLIKTTIESLLARYYGRDRTTQISNDTVNVSGDYTLIAGDISETASNITLHSTKDMLLDSDGKLTEQITGNREIDVDGDDSVHIDGASTVNVGGLRTEVYAGDKTEKVAGANKEEFNNKDTTIKEKWIIHTPDRTIDIAKLPRLSVLDFGAVGDGITDDTDAIMAMINAVGYALFLPKTYKCNLTISNTCALVGYEMSKTILSAFDKTKDVVQVLKSAPYFKIENLTLQDGLNGLHIIDGIGDQIVSCIFKKNSSAGLLIVGKNTSINSALTHIDRCYAELNGSSGFFIDNFADWSMTDSEGVSNASSMGDTSGANLLVKNCAGKVMNSHFWNYNDDFGHFRPASSVTLIASPTEFTNCHMEGGYTVNISINNSSPTFVNCLIYASFGATSIWVDNSPRCRFIGCDLLDQAGDGVSYKPQWIAIFGGNATQGVLQDCYVIGQLFTNDDFTEWKIDINSYSPNKDIMEHLNAYSDVRVRGSIYGNINLDTFILGGGTTINMNNVNGAWVNQPNITLTGNIYQGKSFLIGNAAPTECIVTSPITVLGGGTTFTITTKKSVLCFFSTDTCFVVGL